MEKPTNDELVRGIYTQSGVTYSSEIRMMLTPTLLDAFETQLVHELRIRAQAMRETPIIRDNPVLIGDLFFHPKIVARQARYCIQTALDERLHQLRDKFRVRVSLIFQNQGEVVDCAVGITMEHEKDPDPWMSNGTLLNPIMTPKLSYGITNIRNDHPVKRSAAFFFPLGILPSMQVKQYSIASTSDGPLLAKPFEIPTGGDGEAPIVAVSFGLMAEELEVIKHYMDYAQSVIFNTMLKIYRQHVEPNEVSDRFTSALIYDQWTSVKKKIETYLKDQFARAREMLSSSGKDLPVTALAIMLHLPKPDTKNGMFVDVEYVAMEAPCIGNPLSALTIETTAAPDERFVNLHPPLNKNSVPMLN